MALELSLGLVAHYNGGSRYKSISEVYGYMTEMFSGVKLAVLKH